MKRKKVIGFFLGIIALTLGLTGCANNKTKEATAINFELKDLQGNDHKLSDYAGKKVYVKFWASWCPICLAGLEEVNTLAKDNKDFQVVTIVSPDFRGEKNAEDFKKWFSGLDYKNIIVLLDEDGKVATQYGVRGYPTSTFVSSNGALVKTTLGQNSNEEIKTQFKTVK